MTQKFLFLRAILEDRKEFREILHQYGVGEGGERMKLYEVTVNGVKYRLLSGNAAEAVRKAIVAETDGKDEPENLKLSVEARAIPAIEKVGKA